MESMSEHGKRDQASESDGSDGDWKAHLLKRRKAKSGKLDLSVQRHSSSPIHSEDEKYEEEDYLTMDLPSDDGITAMGQESSGNRASCDFSGHMSKGLKMMEKMGYRVGSKLGSAERSQYALKEPLKLEGQVHRIGIRERPQWGKESPVSETSTTEYRRRLHEENDMQRKQRVFLKMQKLAFEISGDVDIVTSDSDPRDFNVLWRQHVRQIIHKNASATGSEETKNCVSSSDPKEVTEEHQQHEDLEEDVKIIRPQEKSPSSSSSVSTSNDSELNLFEKLTLCEQIAKLHNFLREEFCYCFYCGIQYINGADLHGNCPGFTEDEHY
ncbi:Cmg1p Ecym_3125 [Eremothecium cymbalariae DBVPG|uniref:G-patch domain-containing protein n=1 Tax=Eremothecium cymbalariae (strain CBS 270.75 / DBVPG 7215 / KCTC 17166 / NRRL Y-17582) TaxID=931890 RepID=G8JR60_ERECY|nr:Hypothetical protein Ecym_3125 [Eremothecium cymbalariae DBVPG\